jgi:hypothetical protein
MAESRKARRLLWVLSLTLGLAVYSILLLTLRGTTNIEVIKYNFFELLETIIICWVSGFVFVWVWYWLGRFVVKYGPFM